MGWTGEMSTKFRERQPEGSLLVTKLALVIIGTYSRYCENFVDTSNGLDSRV